MRPLTVVGLTSDGLRLVLRSGNDTFELALRDVPTSRQPALPFATDQAPPTVREIQQRIRTGETSADIAERSGLPLEHVVRYEGPVLAEREHQATRAQRARVEGRPVGELVVEHMARLAQDPEHLVWDAWLVEPGRWEVRAQCGRETLRLRWDPQTLKVQALDEAARHALRLGPVSDDALGAVLRPVSGRAAAVRAPRPAAAAAPVPAAAPPLPAATPLPGAAPLPAAGPVPAVRPVAAAASAATVVPAAVRAPAPTVAAAEGASPDPDSAAAEAGVADTAAAAAPAAVPAAVPAAAPPAPAPAAATPAPAPATAPPASAPAAPAPAAPTPATRTPAAASPRRSGGRPKRAAVPAWGDITAGVAGRAAQPEPAREE